MSVQKIEDDNLSQRIVIRESVVHKLKRLMLDFYNNTNKNFKKSVRKHGNEHFKHVLLDKDIKRVYKNAAKAPVDENKVVFVEVRLPYITNSFEVIFDELANNYDYNIHTHFLRNNQCPRAEYRKRCLNAVEDIATAKYVFVNEASNALSAMPLRPETKIIQLWHGCGAFKKFGMSTADLLFGESRKQQLAHPFYKNYSLVTVSSPEVIWAYNEAMNIDENSDIVQATGSSRTDIFYDDAFIQSCYDHLYEVMPQAKGKKVILYAPTFRGRVAHAKTPDMLNIKMFYDYLGDDYVLLFKHHPLVKHPTPIPPEYSHFAVNMGETMGIEELLCVADVCISDYSSLVFEYSLFEKPLIFFAYDLDEYFDWRGFYYDYFELAPGPVVKTNFEIIDYIQNIDTRFDKKAIQDFRYKFMRSCDGHATQRILESQFDNLENHRKPCDKREKYYTVPKDEGVVTPYFKVVNQVKNNRDIAQLVYSENKNVQLTDSVIALDIASDSIVYLLEKHAGAKKVEFINSADLGVEETTKRIAAAKTILLDHCSRLLDSLELRKETKVVLIPPSAFPLEAYGKNTLSYSSGLKKEIYEIAPLFSSVTSIVAAGSKSGEIIRNTVNENAEILNIGDVYSDIFFDEQLKQTLLDRLYTEYPDFKGRKIIAYSPSQGAALDESLMYEYLYKDYVLLNYYEDNSNDTAVNYYSDSIVNVSEMFSEYELLCVCDIAVGSFSSQLMSFMSASKPVIRFSANVKKEKNQDYLIDVDVLDVIPCFESTMDVVNAILDIEHFDFSKYNSLIKDYLTLCDGNSTKRLLNSL